MHSVFGMESGIQTMCKGRKGQTEPQKKWKIQKEILIVLTGECRRRKQRLQVLSVLHSYEVWE